jgi:predicted N-acetyltransferase YhbS
MLRPITPNDAAAVARLVRAAFAVQSVPTDPPASALRSTAADLHAHFAAGGGGMVVEEEGVIVASIMCSEEDRGPYIARLAVAPACRGHARVLLAAAEEAKGAR